MPSHKHDVTVINDMYGGGTSKQAYQVSIGAYQNRPMISAVAVGGGQAHPNTQPYSTVYFWKRSA